VINDLIEDKIQVGMVDEDPGRPHHARRDAMVVVSATPILQVKRDGNRYLLIVKPELEPCFIRSMELVHLETELPTDPSRLQAILNLPRHPKHARFREELIRLYDESRRRNVATLMTQLHDALRAL